MVLKGSEVSQAVNKILRINNRGDLLYHLCFLGAEIQATRSNSFKDSNFINHELSRS